MVNTSTPGVISVSRARGGDNFNPKVGPDRRSESHGTCVKEKGMGYKVRASEGEGG